MLLLNNSEEDEVALIQNTDDVGVLATDEELLERALVNPDVFTEIVNRYEAAFLRKAEYLLHDRCAAEDIVQETFTKIYLHGRSFKKQEGASFKSWAYRILFTTAMSKYRRLKRDRNATVAIDPELAELMGENGEDVAVRLLKENNDLVTRVMDKLPSPLARVLDLVYFKGYSGEEIAEQEGISHEAVRARVHRAKKKFRELLTESE